MKQTTLDHRISALAKRDLALAKKILAEAIRIPADHINEDPECGLSNHEGPRLVYLREQIIEIGAVRDPKDVGFDDFGNIVWTVEDIHDGIAQDDKTIIYLDGHTDTVKALRSQWARLGGGVDAYDGLTDPKTLRRDVLKSELGYLPPENEWNHLLFGRGSADQLGGVISQIIATRILLELAEEGALTGCIIRSYGSVAEEDNDGGGPMFLVQKVLPTAPPNMYPDVVILTEGTGDANKGGLGIYRGQRGRMQIEVIVNGRSCHGSMPWEGLNPLEFGSAIIKEAAIAYENRDGFLDDPFLGHGTRTASWAVLDSPSDCAVPQEFRFRFDRRLTIGETAEVAIADIERLKAVSVAREAGLEVTIRIPTYNSKTWRDYTPGNRQVYPGWVTPAEHLAIRAAEECYLRVITPNLPPIGSHETKGALRSTPRIDRWIFSTDGVGFPVSINDTTLQIPESKNWIVTETVKHPAMFGIGPGQEQNTHKIGECVDTRELQHTIAFLSRFPSLFREKNL